VDEKTLRLTAVPEDGVSWFDRWNTDHCLLQPEVWVRLVVELLAASEGRSRKTRRLEVEFPVCFGQVFLQGQLDAGRLFATLRLSLL
jgi:hypothetical protein